MPDLLQEIAVGTTLVIGHRRIALRSHPGIGRYVLTDTGRHAFPSPAEVPALMVAALRSAPAAA